MTDDLPPSAMLATRVLSEADSPLTWSELHEETGLPDSTLRDAVDALLEHGYVSRDTNMRDARGHVYELSDVPDSADIRLKSDC